MSRTTTQRIRELGQQLVPLAETTSAEAFAQACREALATFPWDATDSAALVGDLLASDLSGQANLHSKFGEPPVTLLTGPRNFRMEVYFWRGPMTSIHDHSFSGAFRVLRGRSLHQTHRYTVGDEITQGMWRGRLERLHTELLETGTTREILAGDGLVHLVAHLTNPSISLVARREAEQPQIISQFFFSGLKLWPTHELSETAQRHVALGVYAVTTSDDATQTMADIVRNCSDPVAAWTVIETAPARPGSFLLADVIDELGDDCPVWLHDLGKRWVEVQSRLDMHADLNEAQRMLLVLLGNTADRATIARMLHALLPDVVPSQSFVTVLAELADLGAIDVELNDTALTIFAAWFDGGDHAAAAAALRQEYAIPDDVDVDADVAELAASVREHPLLSWLLEA